MAQEDDAPEQQLPEPPATYPIYGYSKIEKSSTDAKSTKKGVRCWEVEIIDDSIPVNQELLDALQWKEDDVIEWKVTEDGFLSFSRVEK